MGISRFFTLTLTLTFTLTFFLTSPSFAGDTPTASQIVRNIQNRYDQIEDAVVKFTQTVVLPLSKVSRTVEGTLYLKKGNKYKLETGNRILTTDGKTSWLYLPGSNQVIIDNYRKDKNTVDPEQFLLAVPSDYFAVLLSTQQTDKDTLYTLRLTPKSDDSFIRSIRIVVGGDWAVRSAEVSDMNDTRSTYTVTELRTNSGLSDSDFRFVPPKGAQVVDMRNR